MEDVVCGNEGIATTIIFIAYMVNIYLIQPSLVKGLVLCLKRGLVKIPFPSITGIFIVTIYFAHYSTCCFVAVRVKSSGGIPVRLLTHNANLT